MNKTLIALALFASTTTAFAGPAADEAKTHFAAIAAGDTATLSRQYDANAQLQWIGGPLDGLYSCSAATHPAGSVIGSAGYICANRVLKDLGKPASSKV